MGLYAEQSLDGTSVPCKGLVRCKRLRTQDNGRPGPTIMGGVHQAACRRHLPGWGQAGAGVLSYSAARGAVATSILPLTSQILHNPKVLWEYSMLKNRVVYDRSGTRSAYQLRCPAHCNDANCKAANLNTAYLFTDSTTYEKLKVLPVAWSRPSVGRLRIPTAVNVYKLPTSTTVGVAVPGGLTAWGSTDWDDQSSWTSIPSNSGYHQPRHIAFVGGGVRIFQDDTSILKDPSLTATTDPLSAAYRFDLFRPEFLAIDIETGTNLLTYYWPKIQNQTAFQNLTSTVTRTGFTNCFR